MDSVKQTLYTIKQLADTERAFSEGSLRWMRFNSAKNGLDQSGALVRVGRRVLIDRERFVAWLISNGTTAGAPAGSLLPRETEAA